MKIISWNVNGIRACYKKNLLDFLKMEDPDIFCIQETKAHKEQVEEPAQKLGFANSYWSSAQRKGYSGVAVFSKEPALEVKTGIGFSEYENEGRILWLSFKEFDLYNIYFPNGGSGEERHEFKQIFLKRLLAHLTVELSLGKKIIVLGDYNVAHESRDVYDPVRLSKESGFLPEERAWFSQFLEAGFVDTFRYFFPQAEGKYSWWSYRELARISNRGWRIDYISTSASLKDRLLSADILDGVMGSDHCPVLLSLS